MNNSNRRAGTVSESDIPHLYCGNTCTMVLWLAAVLVSLDFILACARVLVKGARWCHLGAKARYSTAFISHPRHTEQLTISLRILEPGAMPAMAMML